MFSPDDSQVIDRCHPTEWPWRISQVRDGTHRTFATDIPGAVFYVDSDWSSDDRLVALIGHAHGYSLWTLKPDGSELREVFRDERTLQASAVRWSRDGKRLFVVREHLRGPDLVVFEVDTDRVREAGVVEGAHVVSFAISGDESALYYAHVVTRSELSVVTADRKLPLTTGTDDQTGFALSPDGKTVALARGAQNRMQIQLLPRDGGPGRDLLSVAGSILDVAWSPEGTELVYSVQADGKLTVWRVVTATARATQVPIGDASMDIGDIEWAPRAEIIYLAAGNNVYRAFDPATNTSRALADGSLGWMFNARLSPDGSSMLVCWNRSGEQQSLWLISLLDGATTQVYSDDVQPVGWSQDAKTIYAKTRARPNTRVFAIDVATRHARPRMELPGAAELTTIDGTFVVLATTVSSDLWAMTVAPEPIALPSAVERPPTEAVAVERSLVNGDFEGAFDGVPAQWRFGGLGGRVTRSTDAASGNHTVTLAGGTGPSLLVQRIDASAYRGRRVRLQTRMRIANGATAWIAIDPVVDGEAFRSFGKRLSKRDQWTPVELEFDIRPDAEAIEVRLETAGGDAEFDDVSLELLP